MTELGKNIKLLLKVRKVPRRDVATALGVSEPTIGRYIRGERTPSLEDVVKVAEMFDVTVDWLLTGKESRAGLAPKESRRYILTVAGECSLQEAQDD